MLDRKVLHLLAPSVQNIAHRLLASGLKADHITWIGFIVGISSVPMIVFGQMEWALVLILLNRLADGIDGAMARASQPTDRGAFLDITLDFLFYSAIPLAFALANPVENALAAAILIYSFVGTGCSFLAFAILAEKRGLSSAIYPRKGFYYLGGLTEATETILVFMLMCLMPHWFPILAYGFAALCLVTTITRVAAAYQVFSK